MEQLTERGRLDANQTPLPAEMSDLKRIFLETCNAIDEREGGASPAETLISHLVWNYRNHGALSPKEVREEVEIFEDDTKEILETAARLNSSFLTHGEAFWGSAA